MGGYIGRGQPVAAGGNSVETSDIVDGAVTADKLAPGAAVPDQDTHGGKFLTTDGTDASWATVAAVPDQDTHGGKFLTTDGTDASWATVAATTFPFYKADGSSDTIAITSGAFPFYKSDGSLDNIGVS